LSGGRSSKKRNGCVQQPNAQAAAYCPIIKKHVNDAFTEEEKRWQQVGRRLRFGVSYGVAFVFVSAAIALRVAACGWDLIWYGPKLS
jgi:hypothetical protein